MAEERDPKVSHAYRQLPGGEPSRELDQTILAAAHRSVRPGRQRWYYSLAAAAVLVLAIAVTVHVERQQPDAELAVTPPSPPAAAPQQDKVEPSAETASPPAPPQPRRDVRAREERRQAHTPHVPAAPPAEPATEAEPKPQAGSRAAASRAAPATSPFAVASPQTELERIAELRGQGRDEEADKALAEFRKRYPDYVIPEAMKARVERR